MTMRDSRDFAVFSPGGHAGQLRPVAAAAKLGGRRKSLRARQLRHLKHSTIGTEWHQVERLGSLCVHEACKTQSACLMPHCRPVHCVLASEPTASPNGFASRHQSFRREHPGSAGPGLRRGGTGTASPERKGVVTAAGPQCVTTNLGTAHCTPCAGRSRLLKREHAGACSRL
jgi:hypothetical protein